MSGGAKAFLAALGRHAAGMIATPVDCYDVEPGKLLAGEYPFDRNAAIGTLRLRGLIDRGVRRFFDLTQPVDGLDPYEEALGGLAAELDLDLRRYEFPIQDMGVPDDPERVETLLDKIEDEIAAGRMCYVHCWGGIGRTGTVIGCYLRRRGLDGDEALARVQELYSAGMKKVSRHPFSPQTVGQADYVRRSGGRNEGE